MAIPWGAIATVGGSILSGLFGSKEADEARAFQETAMKNAMQWKVQDLKKAGLNPILASGMNTSVPGGVMPNVPDLGLSVSRGLSTAKENEMLETQMELMRKKVDSEIAVNLATAKNLEASAREATTRTDSGIYEVNVLAQKAIAGTHDSQTKLNLELAAESMMKIENLMVQMESLKAQIEHTYSAVDLMKKEKELKSLDMRLIEEKTKTERILQKLESARAEGERVRTEKEKTGLPEAKTKEEFHKTDIGKFIDIVGEGLRKVVPFFK